MTSSGRSLIALLLFAFVFALHANPFSDSGSAGVATVRVSAPNGTLVSAQFELRERIGASFREWKETSAPGLFAAILFTAFLYGLVHAAGPGHRKTVVFSLYLARKAPVWEPAAVGILLALLHGGSAIIVLCVLRGMSGAISGVAGTISLYAEGFIWVALALLALLLLIHSLSHLIHPHRHGGGRAVSVGTLLLSGIAPCPGAILVLVLSLTLDMLGTGIIAVLAMSVGMSLPVIAAGYLAWFGRVGIFAGFKKNERVVGYVSAGLSLLSYGALFGFSLYTAYPFLITVIQK